MTSADPNATTPDDRRPHGSRLWLSAILLIATGLRLGMLFAGFSELTVDRDAYLALGKSISDGHGLSVPGSTEPTAFRPPLYPLLIAMFRFSGNAQLLLGLFQVACGVLTVGLTYRLGRGISESVGLSAATFTALDPLLLRYVSLPMTETLYTLLCTWLLAELARQTDHPPTYGRNGWRIGAAFGLAALCRPTIWVFAVLGVTVSAIVLLGDAWRERRHGRRSKVTDRLAPQVAIPALLTASVLVGAWGLRNQMAFGRPLLTTTHGGYTLLLGNNEVFDREVVQAPWGTVWQGESLARWQAAVEDELTAEVGPAAAETVRDRHLADRAWTWIAAHPDRFAAAAALRLRRLWQLAPLTESAGLPFALVTGITLWYAAIFLSAMIGTIAILWRRQWSWLPILLMILSVCVLHAFYWSNARMRAPIVPCTALLAAFGLEQLRASLTRLQAK